MKTIKNLSILFISLFTIAIISIISCSNSSDFPNEIVQTNNGGNLPNITDYPIVDTNQSIYYNNSTSISKPSVGEDFYGQDANYNGNHPSYTNNEDGTITDNVTGLMWQQSLDTNGDGTIDAQDKLTYSEAVSGAATFNLGGYTDWRLPTIKEQYSLILFSGIDPSGYEETSTDGLIPFIDTNYFSFAYGDTNSGERIIDSQYASSNLYVDQDLLFGVNFADGRIKGYGLKMPFGPSVDKTFFVTYVRGNETYGINEFSDNGDGTISDLATGLMWMQNDNGEGINWKAALTYAENKDFANYTDWRLPNAKELQSIVDYSRSPGTTNSAAINQVFNSTKIINEAGEVDYPFYWSGTTHSNWTSGNDGSAGAYVSFGRAMGYDPVWTDVHGAGAQRSDPKEGNPDDYPTGNGPQGDAIRIFNYVRLVRNIN